MSDRSSLLARLERQAERHQKTLSLLAALWFVASTAEAAGFIDLPELPWFGGWFWLVIAAIWNALWWGFARPHLERRRLARRGVVVE